MKLRELEDRTNDIMDIYDPNDQWESIFETLHDLETYKTKSKGWKLLFKRLWKEKTNIEKQLKRTTQDLQAKVRRINIYLNTIKKLENKIDKNKKK